MKKIDDKIKWLLLDTVQKQNILPLTSACNMSCIFCSHKNNPPEIKTYRMGHLSLKLIEEMIEYLSPSIPVTIGESATKIIEGEPFLHPDFKNILKLIRQRWPHKKIKIATNGSFLNKSMVKFLKSMEPIELNLSLNCPSPETRQKIMNDPEAGVIFKALDYLKKYKIDFNGSIVALPHILGWKSVKKSLDILNNYCPSTIRVFMPGYTRYSSNDFKFDRNFLTDLRNYINKIKLKYKTPIIVEPPLVKDLFCKIEGIIPGSPAAAVDIEINDIIEKINNEKPFSRVEAYFQLNNLSNPSIKLKRNGKTINCIIKKEKNEKSGIVFNYDISKKKVDKLKKLINSNQYKNCLIITSQLAKYMMKEIKNKLKKDFPDISLSILPVENRYFGGSIKCAGLLVTGDIINTLKEYSKNDYEVIFVPEIIYDPYGEDLRGENYRQISQIFNKDLKLI